MSPPPLRSEDSVDQRASLEEDGVCGHIRNFFEGHEIRGRVWTVGPMATHSPDFHVLEVAPGPRTELWSYVSVGGTLISPPDTAKLEFLVLASERSDRHVELVTMAAYYHVTEHLGEGHTLPIGEPWLPQSACDCLLVSKPYPLGPELEIIDLPDLHGHVLWLLPITAAERKFVSKHGAEALEQRFDDIGLEYWDPARPSAV